MILVDTSVWIDHLRRGEPELEARLHQGRILVHVFVIGELACGNLRNRGEILRLLRDMPQAVRATDEEVLECIEVRKLMGRGIGYADAHLLASTLLTPGTRLWTRDRRLHAAALSLGLARDA